MLRRFIQFICICGILSSGWGMPTPVRVAAATPLVDEQTIQLVDASATPQASDVQSRDLAPVTAPQPFTSIIIKWHVVGNPLDIRVLLRTSTNGIWSDWNELADNDEFRNPDDDINLLSSTMWSMDTPQDTWQLRIDVSGTSSYINYVKSITFSNHTDIPRLVMPSAGLAAPDGTRPPIVTRAMWGGSTVTQWDTRGDACAATPDSCPADATWMPTNAEIARPTHIVIHHTATPNDPLASDWAARVRSIWGYHAITRNWGDIGYHFLIDPNGVIYEGRYKGVRPDAGTVIDGAHVSGYNRSTIGISMMGTFSGVAPTAAAQNALKSLTAWLMTSYDITPDTTAYYAYKNVTLNTIVGHRDIGQTTCPGDVLYGLLPTLRSTLAGIINAEWIDSVRATASTIYAGDSAEFTVKIRNNYGSSSISGAGFSFIQSDTAYTYKQDECWAKRDDAGATMFDKPPQTTDANTRFRIMAGIANWDSQYANTAVKCPTASTINHPWRWSIGTTPLAAGETRDVIGRVQFDTVGRYTIYFGMVKDWVGYPDQTCAPTNNTGVCYLKPLTINVVIRPSATPTLADNIRTRVSMSTATSQAYQSTQQTAQAVVQTARASTMTAAPAATASSIADRRTATAERALGSVTRTHTITPTSMPSATRIAIMQTVSSLREATNVVNRNRTETTVAQRNVQATNTRLQQTAIVLTRVSNLTATKTTRDSLIATHNAATATKQAQVTVARANALTATAEQQARLATQIADRKTATAEATLRSATRTATATMTASATWTLTSTRTATASRTHTATRTPTFTRTVTRSTTPSATVIPIIDQRTVVSRTLSGDIAQILVSPDTVLAVSTYDPVLSCMHPVTLALTCTLPLDGSRAYLMQSNLLDPSQVIVVGQLTWNTLFVQRFDVTYSPPRETAYWTLVSNALPQAMVVNGRYIYLALTQTIPGTSRTQTELLSLYNADSRIYALNPRLPLAGPVTNLINSDTSEYGMVVTGRTTANTGFIQTIQLRNGLLNASVPLVISKPIVQVMAESQVVNLTPINIIYANDGTSIARYQYNISTQSISRISIQNLAAAHISLVSAPTQLLVVSGTAPAQVAIYNNIGNSMQLRGSATLTSATPDVFIASNTHLYWIEAATIYGSDLLR